MLEKNILFILYFLINLLFIIKYGSRVTNIPILFIVIISYFFIVYITLKICQRIKNVHSLCLLFLVCIFLFLWILGQYSIDPMSIKVDRWSAIHNFINYFLDGKYPYLAQTHLGGYGSPFPIWQIFHIPFYLLGNVGLSIFAIFSYFIYVQKRILGNQYALIVLFLFVLSPAFLYEILVRSDLVTNFLLLSSFLQIVLYKGKNLQNSFYSIAILCGLFLSTRLSIAIACIIFFFPSYLQLSIKRKILFPLLVIIIFSFTFLPFIIWNMDELFFFKYNPFILQTRQGSILDVLFICLIICYIVIRLKGDYLKTFCNIAYAYILFIAFVAIHLIISVQSYDVFLTSLFDITYFDMSLPFLICSLGIYLVKRRINSKNIK